MKRALLMFMMLCTAPIAFGQVSIGVRGGMNASNIQFSGSAPEAIGSGYMDPLYSWHADFLLNIPLFNRVYLQPYFRYIRKGATIRDQPWLKPEIPGVEITKGKRLVVDYLELPLNLVYKLPVGRGYLTGGLGPYVGLGLGGNYSYRTVVNGQDVKHEVQQVRFSGRGDDGALVRMAPWEAGAHFSVGFEFFNTLTVAANCNVGLTDTDRNSYSRSRNQYLGLSVGFLFNREDY